MPRSGISWATLSIESSMSPSMLRMILSISMAILIPASTDCRLLFCCRSGRNLLPSTFSQSFICPGPPWRKFCPMGRKVCQFCLIAAFTVLLKEKGSPSTCRRPSATFIRAEMTTWLSSASFGAPIMKSGATLSGKALTRATMFMPPSRESSFSKMGVPLMPPSSSCERYLAICAMVAVCWAATIGPITMTALPEKPTIQAPFITEKRKPRCSLTASAC